jgi:PiT family inorganic phosphate transporter
LIVVGAIASYTLGANNIANVMGLFVSSEPFKGFSSSFINLSGTQLLFLIGGLSIALGIYTYGYRVMVTVGNDLYKITPISGLIVVLAESFVLFLFSSQELERLLMSLGLPTIPLVPLSSTQAVIGAVIGVGFARGGAGINYKILGKIASGWVIAPVVAGIITFVALFFVQNVFEQKVINNLEYEINSSVIKKLNEEGINVDKLKDLSGHRFVNSKKFKENLNAISNFKENELVTIFNYSLVDSIKVDSTELIKYTKRLVFDDEEIEAIKNLHGKVFIHPFEFKDALKNIYNKYSIKVIDTDFETKQNELINLFSFNKHKSNNKE